MSDAINAPPLKAAERDRWSILVVEDCAVDRLLYRRMLTHNTDRYEVTDCETAEEAISLIRERRPDCVLLDQQLPGISGIELLHQLTDSNGELPVPVVMLTGVSDDILTFRAMQAGAFSLLAKGLVSAKSLRVAIRVAIKREIPRKQRILVAEYDYACAAYTGEERIPSARELAHFAIASEFHRLVVSFRSSGSMSRPPNSLRTSGA